VRACEIESARASERASECVRETYIAVDGGIERAHNLHVLIRVEELGVILYLVTCNFFILMMWCLYVLRVFAMRE